MKAKKQHVAAVILALLLVGLSSLKASDQANPAAGTNEPVTALAPGTITTVAGNGTSGFCGDGGPATSACLAFPEGVAVDASGNLFIADPFNHRIRRVDAATQIITTAAGNGT